jgi:hypothetical protein
MPPCDEALLGALSTVKGLFNRILREDQWDWFTVAKQLGYPSGRVAGAIANELANLRTGIKLQDDSVFQLSRQSLMRLPTGRCLSVFLGLRRIADEPGAGWIYILSTRELKDLLKIGMTTRTVEQRASEINGATGLAIPFGVRRCWRVLDPSKAEKLVHSALAEYRLRGDREFFRVDFVSAAKLAGMTLSDAGLEIRTLNALAALG